jgi:hypothetical protein
MAYRLNFEHKTDGGGRGWTGEIEPWVQIPSSSLLMNSISKCFLVVVDYFSFLGNQFFPIK